MNIALKFYAIHHVAFHHVIITNKLLLEDGNDLLLENGGTFLLENSIL